MSGRGQTTRQVKAMLAAAIAQGGLWQENPITGSKFVAELDDVEAQESEAMRALEARRRCAKTLPKALQPLPLNEDERQSHAQRSVTACILSSWARWLAHNSYDLRRIPSFHQYQFYVLCHPVYGELLQGRSPASIDDSVSPWADLRWPYYYYYPAQ